MASRCVYCALTPGCADIELGFLQQSSGKLSLTVTSNSDTTLAQISWNSLLVFFFCTRQQLSNGVGIAASDKLAHFNHNIQPKALEILTYRKNQPIGKCAWNVLIRNVWISYETNERCPKWAKHMFNKMQINSGLVFHTYYDHRICGILHRKTR